MIDIAVYPDDETLRNVIDSLDQVGVRVMPNLERGFRMCTVLAMKTWKSYADGNPMPGTSMKIKNPTGGYSRSIKMRKLGPYNYQVYSDSPYAEYIEYGTHAYDMKKTHPYGARSRVAADGHPYLIIPFKHGAPGTIGKEPVPDQLYAGIRTQIKSGEFRMMKQIKGQTFSPNASGTMVPRARYNKYSRLSGTGIKNLEGLVVSDMSSSQSPRGGMTTFRVVSVNSPEGSWMQPARRGLHVTEHVRDNTESIMKDIIADSIRKDIGL